MTTPLYLKWTKAGRIPSYQGGRPIPRRRWTEPVADPVLCVRGWHACRWEDAVHHISDELWIYRLDGPIVTGGDKVAAGRLLLLDRVEAINERTLRLFAADCAEQVLPIFTKAYPNDDRPAKAIQAARDFAEGRIDRNALVAAWAAAEAARDAARDAAWDAAWAAALDAAEAARDAAWASAVAVAGDAAWAAAEAARDAAWASAGAAAWASARAWQNDRLLAHYGGLDPADYAHRAVTA